MTGYADKAQRDAGASAPPPAISVWGAAGWWRGDGCRHPCRQVRPYL